MRHLTRLEQLYYLRWFLNKQIKNYESDLKEVDEEILKLKKEKK